jgi:hypothetical protein
MSRNKERNITEKSNLENTIVMGLRSSAAILYQMKENAQKIAERNAAPYVFILIFNGL